MLLTEGSVCSCVTVCDVECMKSTKQCFHRFRSLSSVVLSRVTVRGHKTDGRNKTKACSWSGTVLAIMHLRKAYCEMHNAKTRKGHRAWHVAMHFTCVVVALNGQHRGGCTLLCPLSIRCMS
jgi:hypothetical protein